MVLLEAILLLVGLIISLVTLIKLESSKKVLTKRVLSISYILLFIVSIILIIFKYEDTEESALQLFESLNNIEKVITTQSDTLITILGKTDELKKRIDTIVTKTENAIIQREQNQKIFLKQNEILDKSNQLTQRQIDDAKPNVTTYTPHITFSSIDSNETTCRIVLTNEGQRVASQLKHRMIYLLKKKEDDNYFKHYISPTELNEIFPSKMLVVNNFLPIDYKDILSNTNGGTLIILFNYYDELTNDYFEKQFIFKLLIQNDKLGAWRESFMSNPLNDYLTKNKIALSIE